MSRLRVTVWLPFAFVSLLLAAASFGPSTLVASNHARDEIFAASNCTLVSSGGSGTVTNYTIVANEGILQPLGDVPSFRGCYIDQPQAVSNSASRFTIWYWDPLSLAPTAGSIAFRSVLNGATSVAYNLSWHAVPDVVTRALPAVAEPPPTRYAMELRLLNGMTSQVTQLVPDDLSSGATAQRILANGTPSALPGTHPVFVHSVCGGTDFDQNLRIVQCVWKSDEPLGAGTYEYYQRFRVPVATTLLRGEMALASFAGTGGYAQLKIADAEGQLTPAANPTILATAGYALVNENFSHWAHTNEFSPWPTLQPNHDYWLIVTNGTSYSHFGKVLTGTENPYFHAGVGELYRRATAGDPITFVPDRALNFQLVGTPVGTVGVGSPAPSRAKFELSAAPNPARGVVTLAWRGASGGVRFEVLDARGRRVAQGMSAPGETGRWSWNAAGDDGHALPAGLYFVRARDEAGRSTSARVTVVR